MDRFPGSPGAPSQPNPQLLAATRLVTQVTREIESLLPQARFQGSVRVDEQTIERWQRQLQRAVTQLQRIPVIQIYPPPPIARYIDGAVTEINEALAIIASIPIASTRIYPPQPGWANISLRTLQQILANLQAANRFLFQALQA